uniref:Uncharacterized protein n=1 Tax=Aegilops tauschii TaxID=37682 RepID=M8CVY8_AEGTA
MEQWWQLPVLRCSALAGDASAARSPEQVTRFPLREEFDESLEQPDPIPLLVLLENGARNVGPGIGQKPAVARRRRDLADRDRGDADLRARLADSDARLLAALDENAKLVKERDTLALTAKKLSRNLAKGVWAAGPRGRRQQQQLAMVESTTDHHHQYEWSGPVEAFEQAAREFEDKLGRTETKIHLFPASMVDLAERYAAPRTVSIGPYHHGWSHAVLQMESTKHVASWHFVRASGRSVEEVYSAYLLYASTYGGDDEDEGMAVDPALRSAFSSDSDRIFSDVVLLENQLPWVVVETLMSFAPAPGLDLPKLVGRVKGSLQARQALDEKPPAWDSSYTPPHLLGLLRYYIVGTGTKLSSESSRGLSEKAEKVSISVSAVELAEMGIQLTATKTGAELKEMGVRKGLLSGELFLAPLSLDDANAGFLVNMAALELCTTPDFSEAGEERSTVCSYLCLLGMVTDRVEDVQELRTNHILQGGAGLTNEDALRLFISLEKHLRPGRCYLRTMLDIENYRVHRPVRTMVYRVWRPAMSRLPAPPPVPLLLLSPCEARTGAQLVGTKHLCGPDDSWVVRVPDKADGKLFVGSHEGGWVAAVDWRTLVIVNLFSDAEVVEASPIRSPKLEHIAPNCHRKIIFSEDPTSSSCILAAIPHRWSYVAVCKVGGDTSGWTVEKMGEKTIMDIAFCNGELYGLMYPNEELVKFEINIKRLPDTFTEMLDDHQPKNVKLRQPDSGLRRLWDVEVVIRNDHMYLCRGWEQFIRAYDPRHRYFLVFRYDGDAMLTMKAIRAATTTLATAKAAASLATAKAVARMIRNGEGKKRSRVGMRRCSLFCLTMTSRWWWLTMAKRWW